MKKLIRKGKKFNGKSVGMDLHKKFIEYAILDKEGDQIEGGRFPADRDGLRVFVKKLSGKVQFSMEACGSFYWVYDQLSEVYGEEVVHVAQPHKISAIANSGEKNDANDAWWLAYLAYERRLPEAFVAQGDLRELRLATRELRTVTDHRSDYIRRFKSHLLQEGLSITASSFNLVKGRAQAVALIDKLEGVRKTALEKILSNIERFDEEVLFWRETTEELAKSFEEIALIRKAIPGVGPIISNSVYAELGDPRRYKSAKAYGKATGMTPTDRSTGGRTIHGAMSRAGSSAARWSLTRAVIGCLRCKHGPGAVIRRWILNQKKRKAYRKVIVAAARKIAEGIWRLFNLGETFDLAKAFPG